VHVRVAPRAHSRLLTAAIVLACLVPTACAVGSGSDADPNAAISVKWDLDPAPPAAGTPVAARLTLHDKNQQPVLGARLRLEGHMSHPGMAPVVVTLTERGAGIYDAPIEFSMAGDWMLVVTGELPGGGRLTKQIEIAGVRPAS
jgi:hypothetical protein